MKESEAWLRNIVRKAAEDQPHPATWFFFNEGDIVHRQQRAFSKLDPRTTGPYVVKKVGGTYR